MLIFIAASLDRVVRGVRMKMIYKSSPPWIESEVVGDVAVLP